MKYKDIKNKKLSELTLQELSFFMNRLGNWTAKVYDGLNIRVELYDDLSGALWFGTDETHIFSESMVKTISHRFKVMVQEEYG